MLANQISRYSWNLIICKYCYASVVKIHVFDSLDPNKLFDPLASCSNDVSLCFLEEGSGYQPESSAESSESDADLIVEGIVI